MTTPGSPDCAPIPGSPGGPSSDALSARLGSVVTGSRVCVSCIREVTRDPAYRSNRFCHQPLHAGNFILQSLGVASGFLSQREQPDVDSQQSLRNLILELTADVLAFHFLRGQHLVCQLSQSLLQLQGLAQQLGVVLAASLERRFPALAPDDASLQLTIRG